MTNIKNVYSPAKKVPGKFSNANAPARAADNEAANPDAMKAMMGNKSSSLIGRQVEAEAASVDEKIEKLQNLLKMAKGT